jgi:heme-degrading monooxygenase HmoA
MTFRPEETESFEEIFGRYRNQIAAAPGCRSVRLLRCTEQPNIYFTHSLWESEEWLHKYRDSELFAEVWPQTKALFAAKAEAWTVEVQFESVSRRQLDR